MYESVLNLHSRPFHSSPNAEQVYFGHSMHKALSSARMCIDRGNGPALIIGAPGVGKTSLLMILGQQYCDQFHVVNLACSRVDGRLEFLQTVLFELRQPYRGLSEGELRLSLLDFLRSDSPESDGLLLLIDDGENLSVEVLDEIRVVSNFVQDGRPRTRLVLTGGFRLEETLNDARLQSFNQRIAARSFLRNLTQTETLDYVRDQIQRAGGDGYRLFGDASIETIFELTDGCPRFINQVCDHALILCVTHGRREIDAAIVREAWSDLQCFPDVSCNNLSDNPCNSRDKGGDEGSDWSIIEFGSLDESQAFEPETANPQTPAQTTEDHWNENAESSPWQPTFQAESRFESNRPEIESAWDNSIETGYDPYESQTAWSQHPSGDESHEAGATWNLNHSNEAEPHSFSPELSPSDNLPAPPVQPVYIARDPFAERFGEVEVVTSRFASQIARFNRSSQDLTPDDLSCLQSLANDLDQQLTVTDSECESGCECIEHTWSDSNTQESESMGDEDPSWQNLSVSWPEGSELPQVSIPFHAESATEEAAPTQREFGSHQIAREADSLLQQLASAFGEPIEHFDSSRAVSHENFIGGQGCIIRLSTDSIQEHSNDHADSNVSNSSTRSELQELESLKQAIEEQNKFSAQAFDRLTFQNQGQPGNEGWRIRPAVTQPEFTHSYPESNSQASESIPHHDDRDMLICQASDEGSSDQRTQHPTDDRLPFPPTPVSTGRAERMDYQQLFDQLRNLPNT